MILIDKLLFLVTSTKDFGLREENCEKFFDGDNIWPKVIDQPDTIRLCQNVQSDESKYATLCKTGPIFIDIKLIVDSITDGIPVYSAYIINRSPDRPHHPTRLGNQMATH